MTSLTDTQVVTASGGLVELGYAERASTYTIPSTSGSYSTVMFGPVTFVSDGSPLIVEFQSPASSVASPGSIYVNLVVDGSVTGIIYQSIDGSGTQNVGIRASRRLTLSAGTHTIGVSAYGSGSPSPSIQAGNGGVGSFHPMFLRVSKIVQQNDGLKPFWTPPITASLPSNPDTGDQIVYKHGATGNIGSHLPMIYDGTNWQPMGEAVLCRWNCGSATQVFSSTSVTNVTVGDYNTVTFTPPWDGYYEISQKTGMWELNTGIGMQTMFSATDGSANHSLHYIQDWNGPYQHHREGHGMPIVYYLYSAKTYRFTANITYAVGNTGTINFVGTAHVRALSR